MKEKTGCALVLFTSWLLLASEMQSPRRRRPVAGGPEMERPAGPGRTAGLVLFVTVSSMAGSNNYSPKVFHKIEIFYLPRFVRDNGDFHRSER